MEISICKLTITTLYPDIVRFVRLSQHAKAPLLQSLLFNSPIFCTFSNTTSIRLLQEINAAFSITSMFFKKTDLSPVSENA